VSLQVSYKKQFIVIFLLILVFFTGLEILLRTYDFFNPYCDFMTNPVSKDYDYDLKKQICDMWSVRLLYLDPVTGISQNVPNQHFPTVNMNSHGFRGPEIFKEKPENVYRIFMLGGSTTFSIRAFSDQHTISGYLNQNFDEIETSKKIEVINAGIDAITSTDELQLVQSKIVKFSPDLIIIYDGHNDVINFPGKIKGKFNDDLPKQIWKKHLTSWNTPFVVSGIIDKAKESAFPWLMDTNYTGKAQVWKKNIITICQLGKEQGYDTIIILQPILGAGNKNLTDYERELYENKFNDGVVMGYEHFANELIDLENHCLITADFRNIFDNVTKSVYFDRAHVGSESNKIVADEIFQLARPMAN